MQISFSLGAWSRGDVWPATGWRTGSRRPENVTGSDSQAVQHQPGPAAQALRRHGQPQVRNPAQQRVDGDLPLQPGQRCAQAVMHALAERQVPVRLPRDVQRHPGARTAARPGWPMPARQTPSHRAESSPRRSSRPRARIVRSPSAAGRRNATAPRRPA